MKRYQKEPVQGHYWHVFFRLDDDPDEIRVGVEAHNEDEARAQIKDMYSGRELREKAVVKFARVERQ